MSTTFSLSGSDDLLDGAKLTAPMSTGNAQGLLDAIHPAWDEGQGTIGVILTYQLPACLARIKPLLADEPSNRNVRRLAAVLFAAQMLSCDVVYS